jgi:hypothetical protein
MVGEGNYIRPDVFTLLFVLAIKLDVVEADSGVVSSKLTSSSVGLQFFRR